MLTTHMIYLRPLSMADISKDYVDWMNNYEVVKYTESRYSLHTTETLRGFVDGCNNEHNHTFAIVDTQSDLHIGNIKLGGINWHHRYGDIGLVIGRAEFYGKGIATASIQLISDYAFKQLGLRRITCGIYENNVGSIRAFEKVGFQIYGRETKAYVFEGKYIDGILLEKLNPYEE